MASFDNHNFYSKAFKEHGVSAKGVHWNSKKSQYKRFEVLIDFIKKDIKESSLIDIGCGFGDLLLYLKEENLIPKKDYLGVDCEEFMINIAQKRFKDELFYQCNILNEFIPKADYLVCSGAFNILDANDFLLAIERCFKSCKKAFVFNYLLQEESIHKLPQETILRYLKTLTKKIKINTNYLENDCTIILEK